MSRSQHSGRCSGGAGRKPVASGAQADLAVLLEHPFARLLLQIGRAIQSHGSRPPRPILPRHPSVAGLKIRPRASRVSRKTDLAVIKGMRPVPYLLKVAFPEVALIFKVIPLNETKNFVRGSFFVDLHLLAGHRFEVRRFVKECVRANLCAPPNLFPREAYGTAHHTKIACEK